jgi:hypothetical protein
LQQKRPNISRPDVQWSCETCTFIQPKANVKCEICGNQNKSLPRPPEKVSPEKAKQPRARGGGGRAAMLSAIQGLRKDISPQAATAQSEKSGTPDETRAVWESSSKVKVKSVLEKSGTLSVVEHSGSTNSFVTAFADVPMTVGNFMNIYSIYI